MGTFIDITGWVMKEHGVPDSRLTVIRRVENSVSTKTGHIIVKFLCECSCQAHSQIIAASSDIRRGHTLSCGCLAQEISSIVNKDKYVGNLNGWCEDSNSKWLIPSNCGQKVYYDSDDANLIEQYTWYINNNGYAETNISHKKVSMHQLIGCKSYDHKDRDKLNNRKDNLRPATKQENSRNRRPQINNTSGIIGVSFRKETKKWRARIHINKKQKSLGDFENKNDAIKTRLEAEAKYYGEFAPQRHLFEQYGITCER